MEVDTSFLVAEIVEFEVLIVQEKKRAFSVITLAADFKSIFTAHIHRVQNPTQSRFHWWCLRNFLSPKIGSLK